MNDIKTIKRHLTAEQEREIIKSKLRPAQLAIAHNLHINTVYRLLKNRRVVK